MSGTTGYLKGDVSNSTTLTANDHLYEQMINESRESNIFATVGMTENCQYSCDGTADDIQIQAALTAAGTAGGGIVFVKEGTYDISAVLTIPSNVTLQGEGWTTILKDVNGASVQNIITNSDIVNGNTNIIIKDLMVDGNYTAGVVGGTGDGTNYGNLIEFIALDNVCTYCKVVNCKVVKSYDGGGIIFIDFGWDSNTPAFTPLDWLGCKVVGCVVDDIGVGSEATPNGNGKGITLHGAARIEIHSNLVTLCDSQGITLDTSKYSNIHDNLIDNTGVVVTGQGASGIFLSYNTAYTQCCNNIIGVPTGTSSIGIYILLIADYAQTPVGNIINNNIIFQAYNGIYDNGGTETNITNNIFIGVTHDGINIVSGDYKNVNGNLIYNPGGSGIVSASSRLNIKDNLIYSAAGDGINSSCPSATALTNINISGNKVIEAAGNFCILVGGGTNDLDTDNVTVNDNICTGGALNSVKLYLESGELCTVTGNVIDSTTATVHALTLKGQKFTCSGNSIRSDGIGIRLYAATDSVVDGNYIETSGDYSLISEGSTADYNTITNNNVRTKGAGTELNITIVGANSIVKNNLGYATDAIGTANVVGTATAGTITHGLAATPTSVVLSPITALGSAATYYADTFGTTTFLVHTNTGPGGTITFDWRGQV